ncbi:MAG TPA: hypothetical protein PK358_03085 [Spirochaetota bacterium]|nr:hypothetical protein [Spirochaetota bacterium]
MFDNIEIYAGENAAEIINDSGLNEEMIAGIAGASGGPKFLALAGFDNVLLNSWFKKRKETLYFLGSSIGSWRGAAYACEKPAEAHGRLVESYLSQHYDSKPTEKDVTDESLRILDEYLSAEDIDYILNRSSVHLGIISARCTGLSAMRGKTALAASFIPSALLNIASRKILLKIFTRTLFYTERSVPPFAFNFGDEFRIPLSEKNFRQAILSSGSIPFAMEGIRDIDGAPSGTYRDGGITDYHLNLDYGIKQGIVLYPHFSCRIVPGWLDKSIKWRKHDPGLLKNVVLVAPSEKFLKSLPYGKIPDRTDFVTFAGRDRERLTYWHEVIDKSRLLGEEFMEAVNSAKLGGIIKEL